MTTDGFTLPGDEDYTPQQDLRAAALPATVQPDQYAEQLRLGRETGTPADVVGYAPEQFREDAKLRKLDSVAGTKTGAALVNNPTLMRLGHDDIDVLRAFDAAVNGEAPAPAPIGTKDQYAEKQRKAAAMAGRILSGETGGDAPASTLSVAGAFLPRAYAGLQSLSGVGGWLADLSETVGDEALGINVSGAPAERAAAAQRLREASAAGAAEGRQRGREITGRLGQMTYAQERFLDAGTSVATALPLTIAALPLGPLAAAAIPAGVFGAQATGQTWAEDYEQGVGQWQRVLHSTWSGAAETGGEFLPGFKFLKQLKVGSPFVKTMMSNVVNEIGAEEATALAQSFGDYVTREPDKPFTEWLQTLPQLGIDTAITTAMAAGMQSTLTAGVEQSLNILSTREEKRLHAEATQARIAKVVELAQAAKVRTRDTATFNAFMQSVSEDSDMEHLYVAPAAFAQSLQTAGVTPEQLRQFSPELAESLVSSQVAGTDVQVPMPVMVDLITRVEGLEQSLVPELKTEAGGYTPAEAAKFVEEEVGRLEQFFQAEPSPEESGQPAPAEGGEETAPPAEGEQPAAPRKPKTVAAQQREEFDKQVAAVRRTVLKQLNEGGRFTPETNAKFADSFANVISATARRGGVSPESLFAGAGRAQMRTETPTSAWSIFQQPSTTGGEPETAAPAATPAVATAGGGVEVTAQDVAELEQGVKQGSFTPSTKELSLLAAADLSTFHHELGHYYLEMLSELANDPAMPEKFRTQFDAFLKWQGIESRDAWNAMSLREKTPAHEAFARGYEAYLFEGKAPTLGLRDLFRSLKTFITNVYGSIKEIAADPRLATPLEINPEIRGVYDLMMATEEEVANASKLAGLLESLPLDIVDNEGVQALLAEIDHLAADATNEALEEMQRRSLKDFAITSNAKTKALQEINAKVRDLRKGVKVEATANVRSRPEYQAARFFKFGEIPPELVEEGAETAVQTGHKISIEALQNLYRDPNGAPDWRKLGTGKYGMLAKDGIDPDYVTGIFGFRSVDEMVRAMLDAPPEANAIEAETDRIMLTEYGDLTTPEAVENAANKAVHNKARARAVATTVIALERAANVRAPTTAGGSVDSLLRAARQFAERTIGRKTLRSLKPSDYLVAERRNNAAAREALKNVHFDMTRPKTGEPQKRPKDVADAIQFKRNALVNHEQATAAIAAREDVVKSLRYLTKFRNESTRKGIPIPYLEQIDVLLDKLAIRKPSQLSTRQQQQRKWRRENVTPLEAFKEATLKDGIGVTLSPEALALGYQTDYRDLTYDQFKAVIEAIKELEHVGKLTRKLLNKFKNQNFEEAAELIAKEIRANTRREAGFSRDSDRGPFDGVSEKASQFFSIHRRFASTIYEMDAFKNDGVLWDYFIRPMNEAGDKEAETHEQATDALTGLVTKLAASGPKLTKKTNAELPKQPGKKLTREEVVAIALNLGNVTNTRRVMEGENLSPQQLADILGELTPADLEYVKGIWSLLESYRPQIEAQARRLSNKNLEWVEPELAPELAARAKELGVDLGKGGYYPIMYDYTRTSGQKTASTEDAPRGVAAMTSRGHEQARVASVGGGKKLSYNLNVAARHLNSVIHDLAWREYLIDSQRLLRDDGVADAIRETYGVETLRQMDKQMQAIAAGNLSLTDELSGVLNFFRHNASVASLALNLMNAAINTTGITQSMARVGTKWVAKGMIHWMGDAAKLENSVKEIHEKSAFMRRRAKTMTRELNELNRTLDLGGVKGARAGVEKLRRHAYILQTKTQMLVDVPTWWGAYEKALADKNQPAGKDEAEARAVMLADDAVRASQGSGEVQDLADILRGDAAKKLFTSLYAFANSTWNLNAEKIREARFKNTPGKWFTTALDLALVNVMPVFLGALIQGTLRGFSSDDNDDEDDEKSFMQRVIEKTGRDMVGFMLGQLVLLREVSPAAEAIFGGAPYDYHGPSAIRFITNFYDVVKQTAQAFKEDGEFDEAARRAVVRFVGGDLLGAPAAQINRTWDGINAVAEGETEGPVDATGTVLFGAPLKE